jgi:phospholipase C
MSELLDPEGAERLEFEHPDEYLRRRDFLARTAMAAGLAGMSTVLPGQTLVAEAARRQRRNQLPSPRNLPIDTFVVLMMENRSFDHYLGWMPHADGRQAGLTYVDKNGRSLSTRPLAPDWQGCSFNDPDHSWDGGRTQLNGGRCDGFLRSGGNDELSISYYREQDLGFLPAAAREFTTFDHFHCSLMGPTLPNREYMHAAQSYGMVENTFPSPPGFPDTTIFAALKAKGIDSRYFFCDVPVSALWGAPGLARSGRVEEYYARCAAGTLPALSFVDPVFGGSVGEDPGISGDEHPHGDVRMGQAFMADVVHAFMESPQWKRGALFIVYDEWGGFFDHVPSPRVPDLRNSPDITKDFGLMGFRIPAVVVSPWARRRHVNHSTFAFESILKLIEYRFGLGPLNPRDGHAQNIGVAFDWNSKPRLERPSLPHPAHVVSQPCAVSGAGLPTTEVPPAPHDLFELVTSGYLDKLGFDYKQPTLASIVRQPDAVRRAHAVAG